MNLKGARSAGTPQERCKHVGQIAQKAFVMCCCALPKIPNILCKVCVGLCLRCVTFLRSHIVMVLFDDPIVPTLLYNCFLNLAYICARWGGKKPTLSQNPPRSIKASYHKDMHQLYCRYPTSLCGHHPLPPKWKSHLEGRLLDQVQARAPYIPLSGLVLVKSSFCKTK